MWLKLGAKISQTKESSVNREAKQMVLKLSQGPASLGMACVVLSGRSLQRLLDNARGHRSVSASWISA